MLDTVNRPMPPPDRLDLAVEIVAAYVARNSLPAAELPDLLRRVHEAVMAAAAGPAPEPEAEPLRPAVPIKKSVTDDFIVCLENGKRFKSLKRHLATAYGLTPDAYRAKWGLPKDYPMVAPAYADARSSLARKMGLGRKPSEAGPPAVSPEPAPQVEEAPARAPRRRRTGDAAG